MIYLYKLHVCYSLVYSKLISSYKISHVRVPQFFCNFVFFVFDIQEVLAYKLCSARPPRLHKSSSTPDKDLDYDAIVSEPRLRHKSGESELSVTPRFEQAVSRRVKSQENLASSVGSDADYIPLSSSKETVIMSQVAGQQRSDRLEEETCRLLWQRSFACPVMGMNRLDIMGDGMEDLIIVTLKGLHILQVLVWCLIIPTSDIGKIFTLLYNYINEFRMSYCLNFNIFIHIFIPSNFERNIQV